MSRTIKLPSITFLQVPHTKHSECHALSPRALAFKKLSVQGLLQAAHLGASLREQFLHNGLPSRTKNLPSSPSNPPRQLEHTKHAGCHSWSIAVNNRKTPGEKKGYRRGRIWFLLLLGLCLFFPFQNGHLSKTACIQHTPSCRGATLRLCPHSW